MQFKPLLRKNADIVKMPPALNMRRAGAAQFFHANEVYHSSNSPNSNEIEREEEEEEEEEEEDEEFVFVEIRMERTMEMVLLV